MALLSWVTAHGFIMAGCFSALLVWELLRQWKDVSPTDRRMRIGWLTGILLFALGTAWHLRRPTDLNFHMPGHKPWYALVETVRLVIDRVWTPWRWMTVLAILVSAIWFFRRGMLMLWALPTAAVFALFWLVYGEDRHVGVLYLLWAACLWISFDTRLDARRAASDRERRVFAPLFACIVASQLNWTIQTVAYDWTQNYGGARGVALFLKKEGLDSKRIIAVGFHCSAILPYFDRNIFMNWNDGKSPAGWWWSTRFKYFDASDEIVAAKPDVIIRTLKPPIWRAVVPQPGYIGYRKVTEATGGIFLQDRIKEEDSFQIWIRNE